MPKLTSIWDVYNGYITEKRKAGATLEEIGNKIGVTRERIRQVLKQHYGTTKMTPLLTSPQLSHIIGLSTVTINNYRKRDIIKPLNNSLWRPVYGLDAIQTILALRRCQICGEYIFSNHYYYCSDECCKIGRRKFMYRGSFRRFNRKMGLPIYPSIDYIQPKKSPYYKKQEG